MLIYGDLYQNLQWSLTFNLKVVTHLKSASKASYDVINMATIIRNCPLIKAIVCVGIDNYILHDKYPAYWATFRLMAENVIAPSGEFASLSYFKEDSKLRLLIDVCTVFAEALVSDSMLHMLPY